VICGFLHWLLVITEIDKEDNNAIARQGMQLVIMRLFAYVSKPFAPPATPFSSLIDPDTDHSPSSLTASRPRCATLTLEASLQMVLFELSP
jgi:hypothetical protein